MGKCDNKCKQSLLVKDNSEHYDDSNWYSKNKLELKIQTTVT